MSRHEIEKRSKQLIDVVQLDTRTLIAFETFATWRYQANLLGDNKSSNDGLSIDRAWIEHHRVLPGDIPCIFMQ